MDLDTLPRSKYQKHLAMTARAPKFTQNDTLAPSSHLDPYKSTFNSLAQVKKDNK